MISLIYGGKGSGKTKRIIEAVNEACKTNNGYAVYITTRPKHSIQINSSIRFVDSNEYGLKNKDQAIGFLKGILASNSDITAMYIDGFSYMSGMEIEDMEDIFKELELVSKQHQVDFTLTISRDVLPEFLKKYI
jgi:thymidine kinase